MTTAHPRTHRLLDARYTPDPAKATLPCGALSARHVSGKRLRHLSRGRAPYIG